MPEKDDVSKIHDKYTLSLINPSSHYISLAASIVIAGLIGAFTASTYLEMTDLLFPTLGVIAALVGTQFLDILFAKHREYSKSLHVSLFGNSLFFVSTLIGYGAMGLFEKDGLERKESCGGQFREEYATPEGEAKRNDKDYTYVAAWEYKGEPADALLHKEELNFENIEVKERSYK